MLKIIKCCIGTKIISKWSDMACNIALDAVSTVSMEENGRREIDIKRYAKVEKVAVITCVTIMLVRFLVGVHLAWLYCSIGIKLLLHCDEIAEGSPQSTT